VGRTRTARGERAETLGGLDRRARDARDQLAAGAGSGRARNRFRRRVLWIGLLLTVAGAASWAALSRRPTELPPLSAPSTPVPVDATGGGTTNGKAPAPSSGV